MTDEQKNWTWALSFLRSLKGDNDKPSWTYVRIAGAINGSEKSVRRWVQQGVTPMPIHRQSLTRLALRIEREVETTAIPIAV